MLFASLHFPFWFLWLLKLLSFKGETDGKSVDRSQGGVKVDVFSVQILYTKQKQHRIDSLGSPSAGSVPKSKAMLSICEYSQLGLMSLSQVELTKETNGIC